MTELLTKARCLAPKVITPTHRPDSTLPHPFPDEDSLVEEAAPAPRGCPAAPPFSADAYGAASCLEQCSRQIRGPEGS